MSAEASIEEGACVGGKWKGLISVITITYRTGLILADCLAALRCHPEVAEIIIVDNGNNPKLCAMLDRLAAEDSKIRLLRPGRNIGFAAGCNLGESFAAGPWLAFVNPDLIVPPGSFGRILMTLAERRDVWRAGDGTFTLARREIIVDQSVLGMSNLAIFL